MSVTPSSPGLRLAARLTIAAHLGQDWWSPPVAQFRTAVEQG